MALASLSVGSGAPSAAAPPAGFSICGGHAWGGGARAGVGSGSCQRSVLRGWPAAPMAAQVALLHLRKRGRQRLPGSCCQRLDASCPSQRHLEQLCQRGLLALHLALEVGEPQGLPH
jgi:hypothetical protein